MTCSYVRTSRFSGMKVACTHPAQPRKLGMSRVSLCKCHWTRLKKLKRYRAKVNRKKEIRLK